MSPVLIATLVALSGCEGPSGAAFDPHPVRSGTEALSGPMTFSIDGMKRKNGVL